MQVKGLDEDCPTCRRRTGDHTLDEWAVCFGAPTLDLPFEEMPDGTPDALQAQVRERLGIDDEKTLLVDNCVVRALTFDQRSGRLMTKLPGLLMDFQTSGSGAPQPVAKLLFLGDPATQRKFGKLVHDSARGAANAAER